MVEKLVAEFAEAFRDKRYTYDETTVENVKATIREKLAEHMKALPVELPDQSDIHLNPDGSFTVPITISALMLDVVMDDDEGGNDG